MRVTFHGVRGSTPCSGPATARYGGNTSCVAIEGDGYEPIVLDLGTGLRYFGHTQPMDGTFRGHALVTHLHWDHVQGLPFFAPVLRDGAHFDIYGPSQDDGTGIERAFRRFMSDPFFPITIDQFPGRVTFHDFDSGSRTIAGATVTAGSVPHTGRTNGYRIERHGVSVAYLSDHQQPVDGSFGLSDGARALCEGVDLLIHDSQYTPEEFAVKSTWGHCTMDYACWVAAETGARRLALFHHDPAHHDERLSHLADRAIEWGTAAGVEVFAAVEGKRIDLVPAVDHP